MDLSEIGLIELSNSPVTPIMYTALAAVVFALIGAVILWYSQR